MQIASEVPGFSEPSLLGRKKTSAAYITSVLNAALKLLCHGQHAVIFHRHCCAVGKKEEHIYLCRRLGVSQQLCPLGCSLTSLTLRLGLARGKSPSLTFLAFSTKSTEELHPCILTLLNVAINSALFAARSSYLLRLFQPNFRANPILIQPEYWQQAFPFLGWQEYCQKIISETRNGLMLEA